MMNEDARERWSLFIVHHSYFIVSYSCAALH